MLIISHRGFWLRPDEKNAPEAFERTVSEFFGTETDVRDRDGELVVAHDPSTSASLKWSEVTNVFRGTGLRLAVNVKADGLAPLLKSAFAQTGIDWFAFDMSAPEMLRYARSGLPFFTRHSDIEPQPILYQEAGGVWLDAFNSEWFDESVIRTHLAAGKQVCVVSSELHGRPYEDLWSMLRGLGDLGDLLMLCTDFPSQARDYFSR